MDFVGVDDDLSGYKVVIAPMLYMCKDGYDEKIRSFVKAGGTFLTSYFSGYVEDHDLVITGGYPGRLRDILGIWVEESDAIPAGDAGMKHTFAYKDVTYPAEVLCDLSHTEGAETLSTYDNDFYAGMPVLTCNTFGSGKACYVATRSNQDFYRTFLTDIMKEAGVEPLAEGSDKVEITLRENKNGSFLFLLNPTDESQEVTLKKAGTDLLGGMTYQAGEKVVLPAKAVAIVQSR